MSSVLIFNELNGQTCAKNMILLESSFLANHFKEIIIINDLFVISLYEKSIEKYDYNNSDLL